MDGIQGMFGQDPALIQQAIQQQRQQEYNAAANTPQGRGIVSLAAQGGGMLGDALGAATGVKDPRIAEAQLGQQVQQRVIEQAKMQGIDPVADPESFIKLVAQGWMDAGKPEKAYAAVNTLQQMQAQKSKMGLESAQAQKALREDQFISVPKGASVFDRKTGAYSSAPSSIEALPDVNNDNDIISWLAKYKAMQRSGKEISQEQADIASALYSKVTTDRVDMQGNKISGLPVPHLNPTQQQVKEAPFAVTLSPKGKDYLDSLMAKGVREDVAARAVQKIGGDLVVPTNPELLAGMNIPTQAPMATGERVVTPNPEVIRASNVKQAVDIEQRFRDDYTKSIEKPKLVLEASDQIRELAKHPTPTNLNAMATIGQHLIEPTNQALQNEINRLVGGGSLMEKVRGVVSNVLEGTASPQQIKWFNGYAEDMRNAAIKNYKSTLSENYSSLKAYSDTNKEVNPSRVVNAEQLARFENLPFVRNNDDYAKLKKGQLYYSISDIDKRVKQ